MTSATPGWPEADTGGRDLVSYAPAAVDRPARLSARQLEVLRFMAEGLTNIEIAGQLHIDPRTVATHVAEIIVRLGARNGKHAVALAFRRRLID